MSDMLRLTGLVSGIDTDTIIKKLIKTEQIKVDKAKQEKQYLEWQKEDYREVANIIRGFQDEFLDVLNPKSNMKSASSFNMFSGSATVADISSSAVTIKTTSSSVIGSFTIDSVAQLATKDVYESGTEVLGDIVSGNMDTIDDINTQLVLDNSLEFTFDGVTKAIFLDEAGYADHQAFADAITTKLQDVFTNVDIKADLAGDQITFKIYEKGTTSSEDGHSLVVGSDNSDLLEIIKLNKGQSNTVNTSKSPAAIFGGSGDILLTINNKDFVFAEDMSIKEIMNEINSSSAKVEMSYDSFADKFRLESTGVGTDNVITFDDTSSMLANFKLDGGSVHTAALNAEFEVNGVTTTRSSNDFVINGTKVTLNEIPTGPVTVDIESDPTDVKDMIVKFVDSYNEMIKKITDLYSSSKNYDYSPLTADQKEGMSDDDIETWQIQARKGTLNSDYTLEKLTRNLRTTLYTSVDGLGINLFDIGIQTSSSYKDQGKLVIDDDKLDKALKERPNEVIELFTKQSETPYDNLDDRSIRTSENGIAFRMYDILQDNIRLTRDIKGKKGYLIEKAGFETGVDTTSFMAKKILTMDIKIDDLLDMLADQEDRYYSQFSAMESAMSRLQSQGDALLAQFG